MKCFHRVVALSALSLVALACFPGCFRKAAVFGLNSPDGKLSFVLEDHGGLIWSVTRAGVPVITNGALGVVIGNPPRLLPSPESKVSLLSSRSVDTTWTNSFGERLLVRDRYNEEVFSLQPETGRGEKITLQVRAYDEGIAFRYGIRGAGEITVKGEKTTFPLPSPDTPVWTTTSAQGPILKGPVSGLKACVDRPVLAEIGNGLVAAVGEAGLVDYSRMRFTASNNALVATLERDTNGTVIPFGFTNGFFTPWRFVMVAESPSKLAESSDFVLNLNEPSKIDDTSWIKPGKVIRDRTLTTQGGKACIDFATEQNLGYVLLDAGWYGPEGKDSSVATGVNIDPARYTGPLDLPEVMAYARQKGVGVILYVNYRALRNGRIDTILPLFKSWGVAGIKFGFVPVGDREVTKRLHEWIEKAAAQGMVLDIHDEYRPTGITRTWPNVLTAEGIRGDEENKKRPADNAQILKSLFTRCLMGPADQTNCYFDNEIVGRLGSHGSQLAKTIVIPSSLQTLFWYDLPPGAPPRGGGGVIDPSVTEMEFFRQLPTTWEETRFLEGKPGAFASVARRKGDVWYLGCLNGDEARTFSFPLGFLKPGTAYRMEIFHDDPSSPSVTKISKETVLIKGDAPFSLHRDVAARNGFAAILTPLTK